jgi:hypothetical protein
MSVVPRRFTFIVDDDVELDVDDCLNEDPDEAAVIIAIIEELQGDRGQCERLINEAYEDEAIQSVKQFKALQDRYYNAYTVRLLEVDNWRLITAVDHRQHIIALLYIMRRDEDYDDEVQRRVISAYEKLGLYKIRG